MLKFAQDVSLRNKTPCSGTPRGSICIALLPDLYLFLPFPPPPSYRVNVLIEIWEEPDARKKLTELFKEHLTPHVPKGQQWRVWQCVHGYFAKLKANVAAMDSDVPKRTPPKKFMERPNVPRYEAFHVPSSDEDEGPLPIKVSISAPVSAEPSDEEDVIHQPVAPEPSAPHAKEEDTAPIFSADNNPLPKTMIEFLRKVRLI